MLGNNLKNIFPVVYKVIWKAGDAFKKSKSMGISIGTMVNGRNSQRQFMYAKITIRM